MKRFIQNIIWNRQFKKLSPEEQMEARIKLRKLLAEVKEMADKNQAMLDHVRANIKDDSK